MYSAKMARKHQEKQPVNQAFTVPAEWTFRNRGVAEAFDAHVRESLPWYDLATGIIAHIGRCYIPPGGIVIDVGASTGNIGRALAPCLAARSASLIAIEAASEFKDMY